MRSSWMLRAAAAPELFLIRGLTRFLSRLNADAPQARARALAGRDLAKNPRAAFALELPRELVLLFEAGAARELGDFVPGPPSSMPRGSKTTETFVTLLDAAQRNAAAATPGTLRTRVVHAKLTSYLAGTVAFGTTHSGELWLYVLGEPTSPSRGVIATLDPAVPNAPHLAFRDTSTFAFACALDASAAAGEDASVVTELRTRLPVPGVAEQEGVRTAFERAAALVELLTAPDPALKRAAKKLAMRPFEPPHPPLRVRRLARTQSPARPPKSGTQMTGARGDRTSPLALGPLLEAFFRTEDAELPAIVVAQLSSRDRVVREAAELLSNALSPAPSTALARDLARRRGLALRTARAATKPIAASPNDRALLTRAIIEVLDASRNATDPLAVSEPREEALLALAELGERSCVPSLVARAVTGDVGAVDMLAALRDPQAVAPLTSLLEREPQKSRLLEAAAARALATLGAKSASHALCTLLANNPMPSWREGIERGVLVKELVAALGALCDASAGPALLEVLEATSQEYKAILPVAAWALGRVNHLPALVTLERLLTSPKEPPTCEAIWAVGAIGEAHPEGRDAAGAILDRLTGLEPGAEMVRLTALAKVRAGTGDGPRTGELKKALERALWEPAFRQEESSRRRIWAFRSLEELAGISSGTRSSRGRSDDADPYFLGHEAIRYFVTRDDHRVRRAAEEAFAAWGLPVPATRRYYVFVLDALEARGGLPALHEALRDPLGIFRHNVATRLAERADASSVRPLAEATARLFAEPPTSTYEYDDAPSHMIAFVRALSKLNQPEGNDVLIDGLRAGSHQVRAVVADNAPDDERFVPELKAMLGDPRSFLRSRAERSLASLGVTPRL